MSIRKFLRLSAYIHLLPVLESGEETLVGGQAVMEGVMMRAPHSFCIAVRRPDGEIVIKESPIHRMSEKYPIFKLPVLRGIGTLGQAMQLGVKALQFSTEVATEEAVAPDSACTPAAQSKKDKAAKLMMAGSLLFSLVSFIVLYKWIPLQLTHEMEKFFPVIHNRILFNLVDGVIRMGIFLTFLFAISRRREIRRVFQYHGAEHKVVFNFESGKPVTVENAQEFVTWHPRCGTSFLIVVMVVSMLVYMLLPFDGFAAKFAARLVLLLPIAGISYELIRFAAKRPGGFLAMITAPGLWLQKITTQPPSDEQAEVAIQALEGAMKLEERQGGPLVIA